MMKIVVITNRDGKIIGTAHQTQGDPVAGYGGPGAGPGQKVQVIDFPSELERQQSAEELHRALEQHLHSGHSKQ